MSTPETASKYRFPEDVAASLHRLMSDHGFTSEDDVLRIALERMLEDESAIDDDWPAIKEALDELDAGKTGLPVKEAFAELRRELGVDDE